MGTTKWEAPQSATTILSTGLNSLGDGANAISAAQSNDAAGELYLYADFELYIAATSARAADARVELYILIELDGSNYSYGGTALDPAPSMHVGDFQFDASGTAARYAHIRGVLLPPTDYKVLLINELGVAMASSGNTLKISEYNIQT